MLPALAHLRPARAPIRSLIACALIALATPTGALAASQSTARQTQTQTYSVPKFPVPASARVKAGTGGTTAVSPGASSLTPGSTVKAAPTTTIPTTVTTAPTATVPTTASAPTRGARTAASKPSGGSSGPSTPALLAAAIAALLALGCAAWSVARLQAYEPRWTLSLRHTLAEAGFRASATWAEFSDWARLGR